MCWVAALAVRVSRLKLRSTSALTDFAVCVRVRCVHDSLSSKPVVGRAFVARTGDYGALLLMMGRGIQKQSAWHFLVRVTEIGVGRRRWYT